MTGGLLGWSGVVFFNAGAILLGCCVANRLTAREADGFESLITATGACHMAWSLPHKLVKACKIIKSDAKRMDSKNKDKEMNEPAAPKTGLKKLEL